MEQHKTILSTIHILVHSFMTLILRELFRESGFEKRNKEEVEPEKRRP